MWSVLAHAPSDGVQRWEISNREGKTVDACRFVDAVASVGFGAALRLTAGKVWSLERERERNRAIQTVFVASKSSR